MNPREYLESVALSLGELRERFVFVGGMVRSLLVTDPAVPSVRPTLDVDLIVEIHSRTEWAELEPALRGAGFRPDMRKEAPLCRYLLSHPERPEVTVDFMPLDPSIFGFSNSFYPSAYEHARRHRVGTTEIRVIDAVHFVATKLEALSSRGEGDYYHHDLEDVLVVLDGRAEFEEELTTAPTSVRDFVAQRMSELYEDREFHMCLPGHLPGDPGNQARLPSLIERIERLAQLSTTALTTP